MLMLSSGLLRLSPDGRGGIKCEEVYYLNSKTAENQCGQYVLLGDFIYMASGMYTGTPMCIEWSTGKIAWKADERIGRGAVSVIAADGMLIFRSESHDVVLVEATPSGYHPIGRFKEAIGRVPGSAHPVVAGGCLYLRDRDMLTCYDLTARP